MYVVVEHTFRDREKPVEAGQALFSPPAGITLHILPSQRRRIKCHLPVRSGLR